MIIKMLLFPVAIIAVLYLIIVQLVPGFKDISKTKEKIVTQSEALNTANAELARIKAFEQEVQSKSAEKEFMFGFVPDGKKEEILLSDISQLADNSGVTLFSIAFEGGDTDEKDARTNIMEGSMIVSGTYGQVKSFMHQLYRIDRLYDFKNFNLVKIEQAENEDGTKSELLLNGNVAFAYKFMSDTPTVTSDIANEEIDFKLIDTVMNAIAETEPLNTETAYRANPFLP